MRIALPIELSDPCVLAKAFGAMLVLKGKPQGCVRGIATHSDEVEKGDLFLCLSGAVHHGLAFAEKAVRRGAIALLYEAENVQIEGNLYCFRVSNTEHALLHAASVYRQMVGARVIAVTGSTGKTTVKEAIAAILGNVPHSKGNFNSTLGMPLSVLSMPRAFHWVVELGVNHVGEMRKMARALSPDVALITNVGSAHIGHFGDFSTILREKTELAWALDEKGTLVLPDELAPFLPSLPPSRILRVGKGEECDVRIERASSDANGAYCDLTYQGESVSRLCFSTPGRIGVSVIGLCAAVGLCEGRTPEEIREGLRYAGVHTPRMNRIEKGEHLLLDDSYNASPEAMAGSLEVLRMIAGERPCVAVLGDMRELGQYAVSLHDAVGVCAAKSGISMLFTYGKDAAAIAMGAMRHGMPRHAVFHFPFGEEEELARTLALKMPPRAVVLFKASGKTGMGEIVKSVRGML